MRFRLPILVVTLAVYLLFGFAALAQLRPATVAKPRGKVLPVYLDWKTLKCKPTPTCTITRNGTLPPVFLCDDQVVDALPVAQPCIGLARSSADIREIDLDGLKKILQRDPKDTRPLLINFWATWCDGCREEFPDLVKIDNDYRDKLNFVSITLDEVTDIKTTVPAFLKAMKAQMSVVLLNVKDPEPAIHAVDATWDGALPATYLYDKDGKVVFKYFGAIKPAELRSAIDKAVSSRR